MTLTGVAAVTSGAVAVVLAWAGARKAVDPAGTAEGFARLGLDAPGRWARVVPVTELGTAGAVIVVPPAGAAAAIALLAVFTVVLVIAWRRPEPVPCACFSTARSEPVGPADIVRNLGLAALVSPALGGTTLPTAPEAVVGGGLVALVASATAAVRSASRARRGAGPPAEGSPAGSARTGAGHRSPRGGGARVVPGPPSIGGDNRRGSPDPRTSTPGRPGGG